MSDHKECSPVFIGSEACPAAGMAITVAHVSKRFKRVAALTDVSIAVRPGEIYGLLGRNGAGKTTLVKILLDLTRPTTGKTFLLNASSRSPSVRRWVGYLPEDHRFPEYQTGFRALAFYAALSGVPLPIRKDRIWALLDQVELREAAHRKIRTYSKGMKQRLGLAQALVSDPRILFLDEPTDGVDPVGRARIRDNLLKLKGQGKTIFLNSHLLGEVEQVCDRVGILNNGALAAEGTLEELTKVERGISIQTKTAPDDAVMAELNAKVVSAVRKDHGLEVKLAADGDIDAVVDLLRARGLSIRGLNSHRLTLEDVFLGLVSSGEEEQAC